MRKVCRVRLTSGFEVSSYIGGEGHNLHKSTVLFLSVVVVLRLTRCTLPYRSWFFRLCYVKDRNQSRSKYGAKRPKK